MIDLPVAALLVGRPEPLGPRRVPSSIAARRRVGGPVAIGPLGLEGDAVGDPKHHGGPDKAIHHYPLDHHDAWRAELGPEPPAILGEPGAFGENLATAGLTEAGVCVGDVLRLGTARVEVAQGRQPCFKLNHRFGRPDMARRVQASGRTGWYYRVLEPGRVAAGDRLALLDRPHPDWPVARALRALHLSTLDRAALEGLASLPPLAPGWRELARRRLETGRIENWSRRLGEPFAGPTA